ncbi:uncharacterized protein LOC132734366 isoform X2 [Ruditapes philippinarum]|jgi:hypothetical protein|uniref:uncharacterized protein LOC132734366 isoform X2 n=1 Tax=Ruditapes philippinarum TaxID=129788 RepID=UPI00295BAB68|nr:uncharacterized protein LOC132734366 isoform X2 [Ruditapes philippinarum]XP_060577088.1 uncharacterized protein LOC132734366 isoform X2 [Ruditapes philippinarum]
MSYLRRWRKFHAEATAIALESSSSEDEISALDERNSSWNESENASGSSVEESDNSVDSVNDYGFVQNIESSDTETCQSDPDFSENEELPSFREKLSAWASTNKLTKGTVDELLQILKKEGHAELPKDSRTLLQTPRTVDCEDKCGGKYIYYGLRNGFLKILTHSAFTGNSDHTDHINFNVNIDGIPLFKSSGSQFWPILCSIQGFGPFLVALYFGNAKPNSLNDYLSDFLQELEDIQQNGITHNSQHYQMKLRAFVCDAPARAFLKGIKGHTGYYACERCTVKGFWKGNRIVFISTNDHPSRTDTEFENRSYPDHQTSETPLVQFGIRCVTSFCLDYMHLVCLGVVKRILWFLKQGPNECKLSQRQLYEISDKLLSFSGKMPSEFARQPRTLTELERWKATEFRQFLLYTGPVVLRKIISKQMYEHFLSLTVAISILLNSEDEKRAAYLNYADNLLKYFVDKSKDIYSENFVVYNIHGLKHLCDDARNLNCSLNEISAFPYENYLQSIKHMVKNSKNPIVQVTKRIAEREFSKCEDLKVASTYTTVSTKPRNRCFMLLNETFVFIREKRDNGRFVCDLLRQRDCENFFTTPCESKLINVVFVKKRTRMTRRLVEKEELGRKAVCLPFDDGYVLVPMLHGVEK